MPSVIETAYVWWVGPCVWIWTHCIPMNFHGCTRVGLAILTYLGSSGSSMGHKEIDLPSFIEHEQVSVGWQTILSVCTRVHKLLTTSVIPTNHFIFYFICVTRRFDLKGIFLILSTNHRREFLPLFWSILDSTDSTVFISLFFSLFPSFMNSAKELNEVFNKTTKFPNWSKTYLYALKIVQMDQMYILWDIM